MFGDLVDVTARVNVGFRTPHKYNTDGYLDRVATLAPKRPSLIQQRLLLPPEFLLLFCVTTLHQDANAFISWWDVEEKPSTVTFV